MAYPAARVQRTLPFPRERVYRAWLDPKTMVRWFVDPTFTDGRAEVDERVGGHYRIFQVDPEGAMTGGSENRILELVPNERIVLSWRFAGPNRDEDLSPETRITVTFAEPRPGRDRADRRPRAARRRWPRRCRRSPGTWRPAGTTPWTGWRRPSTPRR